MIANVPPQNPEVEASLLGACLVSSQALRSTLAEGLRAEDFYLERHGRIWGAMCALAQRGAPTDEVSVVDRLSAEGILEEVGGKDFIPDLAAKTRAPGNAKHYAEIVTELARWRYRLQAAQAMQIAALERDDESFAKAQALLAQGVTRQSALYGVDRQRDLLWELMEGKSAAEFFWPFEKLNDLQSGGMRRGQLIVLSGYNGDGKSHFADQILDRNRDGAKVCLYDNEMDVTERAVRRASRLAGISYGDLMNGRADHKATLKYLNSDAGWPIVDTAGWSAEEVCHHIRHHRWDLVVIDILHNFPYKDERELSAAVGQFKAAAKQARCCVVLVAHVSRVGIERGKRRPPVKSDLRWSGDIENLADVVCFVYREQDDKLRQTPQGAIYFDKCRGGELGGIEAYFNSRRLRWEEAATDPISMQIGAAA